MTDFHVQDHGSIIILLPQTTVAKDWADEHFPEDAANWANGTAVSYTHLTLPA